MTKAQKVAYVMSILELGLVDEETAKSMLSIMQIDKQYIKFKDNPLWRAVNEHKMERKDN